jgi:ABC-type phosphate/phosphonate transport system substrate-binding protein
MEKAIFGAIFEFLRLAILSLVLGVNANAFAQKPAAAKGAEAQGRLVLAINEGAAGSFNAMEIVFRYEEFRPVLEKALGAPVPLVAVRSAKDLRNGVATGLYTLVMSRPADVLAEAIRDHGFQAVVSAKEPAYALFIVNKDSPLKTIVDIRGKSIVTPDRYAYMWRIANAMMRDSSISLEKEQVRNMGDQAAIGWAMETRFFDVGVVSSTSGVGRSWEKGGGRVLARSREVPNTSIIASSKISAAQIQKLRATLVALGSTESGAAILKKIGVNGFRETSSQTFLDLLKWLGDLEAGKG